MEYDYDKRAYIERLCTESAANYFSSVPRFRFIEPCQPIFRDRRQRVQIGFTKATSTAIGCSFKGVATQSPSSPGYPTIARALTRVPAKSVILDGELVASSIECIFDLRATPPRQTPRARSIVRLGV